MPRIKESKTKSYYILLKEGNITASTEKSSITERTCASICVQLLSMGGDLTFVAWAQSIQDQ